MPERERILLVDDDDDMRETIAAVLRGSGFDVVEAESIVSAISAFQENRIHLVVLDLMLGKEDGLDLMRDIRSRSKVPVVMLTGRGDVIDKVVGLELGADDYITKPFHNRELLARIGSVLRRSDATESAQPAGHRSVLRFDGWELDLDSANLKSADGQSVQLTTYELQVLTVLIRHPKRALSRSQIMDLVADKEWDPYDRSLDVLVAKLRKKLRDDPDEPKFIRTVRNIGYMFVAPVSKGA